LYILVLLVLAQKFLWQGIEFGQFGDELVQLPASVIQCSRKVVGEMECADCLLGADAFKRYAGFLILRLCRSGKRSDSHCRLMASAPTLVGDFVCLRVGDKLRATG